MKAVEWIGDISREWRRRGVEAKRIKDRIGETALRICGIEGIADETLVDKTRFNLEHASSYYGDALSALPQSDYFIPKRIMLFNGDTAYVVRVYENTLPLMRRGDVKITTGFKNGEFEKVEDKNLEELQEIDDLLLTWCEYLKCEELETV